MNKKKIIKEINEKKEEINFKEDIILFLRKFE
jgi:hypothetical protein